MELLTTHQRALVPTIGGIILFGTERLKYFHDAWIQAGRFHGLSKTKILDSQEITSYPVFAITDAMGGLILMDF